MTNEIQRIEKPGRLERIKGILLKPLGGRTQDRAINVLGGFSEGILSMGLVTWEPHLMYLGLSALSYNYYLMKRAYFD